MNQRVFSNQEHQEHGPYITFRRYNKALRRLVKLPGYLGTSHGCPVTSAWAITSASTAGVILSTA